jgi:hypothetical protein
LAEFGWLAMAKVLAGELLALELALLFITVRREEEELSESRVKYSTSSRLISKTYHCQNFAHQSLDCYPWLEKHFLHSYNLHDSWKEIELGIAWL